MYQYRLSAKFDGKAKTVFCQYNEIVVKIYRVVDVIPVQTQFLKPLYDKVQRKLIE